MAYTEDLVCYRGLNTPTRPNTPCLPEGNFAGMVLAVLAVSVELV